ncbi:ribonuclease D [Stella sp.]|uniref:ribonuclease D n=1 Tax=Stella sp. TaxID=2912054 RepID=UPI0035B01E62
MTLIADTEALIAFCQRQSGADYIAVDTEFMRDKTYWPQLCLVQIAGPEEAAAVDPLAAGIDLAPLIELLFDERIVKVFHAARQDIEIFYHLTGRIPEPLFDTQVAAMVCGFGEAVSYENLATKLAGARIDKSSRFTDWAQRPLTQRQLTYALSDVTHLRPTYEKLRRRLERSGRGEWLDEEMNVLLEPGTYRLDPVESWRRFKIRGGSGRFLAVLQEVAAWRERTAQEKDMPRGRILRDEAILEIAAHHPTSVDDLARTRGLGKGLAEGRFGTEILEAVQRGLSLPESQLPKPPPRQDMPPGLGPLCDLLRVLLKMKCEEHDVAQKLVASADDLERIAASDDAKVPALEGWRREVFGQHALALKHGRLGLTAHGKSIAVVSLGEAA